MHFDISATVCLKNKNVIFTNENIKLVWNKICLQHSYTFSIEFVDKLIFAQEKMDSG